MEFIMMTMTCSLYLKRNRDLSESKGSPGTANPINRALLNHSSWNRSICDRDVLFLSPPSSRGK